MRDHRRRGRPPVFSDANTVTVGVRLHPSTRERLKAFASEREITLSDAVRRVFAEWERQFEGDPEKE
jgi:hypothetical protein